MDEKLKDTLLDEAQFELLMDWMYSEFSCEIMLSVIEYVQFKAVLDEYEQSTDTAEEIIFYAEIPRSTIVHGVNGSMAEHLEETRDPLTGLARMSTIAGALYKKYIERHSELEINISSSLRNRWNSLHSRKYPENDLTELVSAVDEVISEMLKYIRQAFIRFDIDRKH